MKNLIKKLFSAPIIRFAMVGALNTLVGAAIMFGSYNLLGIPKEIAELLNYTLTSVMSFFINKSFTFRDRESVNVWTYAWKFALVIIVCYFFAFLPEKLIMAKLFVEKSEALRGNVSMVVHNVSFFILNYIGQRFFAFPKKKQTGEQSEEPSREEDHNA